MANRLPEYYIVYADLGNPLWFDYVAHLNSIWVGAKHFGTKSGFWYGYDGGRIMNRINGTGYYSDPKYFSNNPTQLTLEEFFDLKKEVETSMIKVTSAHKETVKSVAIHIEIEGEDKIQTLINDIYSVMSTFHGKCPNSIVEIINGIKSQLKG